MSSTETRRLSVRTRLALMLAAGLGLTLAIGFLGLHSIVRNQLYESVQARVEARMQSLAEFAAGNPGNESAADSMLQFRSRAHENYFEIRDGSGQVLARSGSSGGRDIMRPSRPPAGQPVTYGLLLPDGHAGIAVAGVFELPDTDPRDRLLVIVAEEIEQLDALEQRIHRAMLLMALFSVLAGVAATTFAIRSALSPLDRLARSAESIDPDGPRVELDIGDLPRELAVPGGKLSQLLRRVFDSRDRERWFHRVVAHELRTPLAEMRMLADVGVLSQSCEKARSALREVGAASVELQRIVDILLALARYESGQETPQAEPVDLVEELRRQLDALSGAAAERRISIEAQLPRERWIIVDSGLLRRLLSNLLGNAVGHAPRESSVQVSLETDGSLRVRNHAPHLRPEDLAHLGERFFRVASGGGGDGSHAGLGSSLAAAVARVARLNLAWELDDRGRLVTSIGGFQALGDRTATAEEYTA